MPMGSGGSATRGMLPALTVKVVEFGLANVSAPSWFV